MVRSAPTAEWGGPVFDPAYHRSLAAGARPMEEVDPLLYWEASVHKVVRQAAQYRMPDHGGCNLLLALGSSWREVATQALATGDWEFSPLLPNFEYKGKLQTSSSLLDRLIIQLAIGEVGYHMQVERINTLCDDELMPIPPPYRFRPPLAPEMYSPWREDLQLWRSAERLFALRGYAWVVKTDIRDCFYNIPRGAVLDIFRRELCDPARMSLLERRLEGPVRFHGQDCNLQFGLPVSEPCCHLLANLYLAQFDRWVIRSLRVPHLRYVDDMRFYCHSQQEGYDVLTAVKEELAVRFGLILNSEKCAVVPVEGTPDAEDAANLLAMLKERIQEPLELRNAIFVKVSREQIMEEFAKIEAAVLRNDISGEDFGKLLDQLASLRPPDSLEGAASFIRVVSSILNRVCRPEVPPSENRIRVVATVFKHLLKTDGAVTVRVCKSFLDHADPAVARQAFQWMVWTRRPEAQAFAEARILILAATGQMDDAADRLVIYRNVFGLTPVLRETFRNSASESIRTLASSPGGSEEEDPDHLREGLTDNSARVRRNAGLRAAGWGLQDDGLRKACLEALEKETDRDARLALLLALHAVELPMESERLPEAGQPRTTLESAILEGLQRGLVCMNEVHRLTYRYLTRLRQAQAEESGAEDAEEPAWTGAAGGVSGGGGS